MVKLPSIERQRLLPTTTGAQRLQAVKVYDPVAEAIGNAGNLVVGIQNKMFEADSAAQLSAANVNTQMELSILSTELAKGNSETAMADYATRAAAIYAKNSEGMSPIVQGQYDASFGTLNAKTNLSLAGTVATKRSGERVAVTLSSLDTLVKFNAVSDDPDVVKNGLALAQATLQQRVEANDIKPAAAEKLWIKFQDDYNNATFTRYVNRLDASEVNSAFKQMSSGQFMMKDANGDMVIDKETSTAWAKLSEQRKAALISTNLANGRNLLRANDAEIARVAKLDLGTARRLSREFYSKGSTPERRSEILFLLESNDQVRGEVYNKMVQDNAGATERFDDPDAIRDMDVRVMHYGATGNDVTINEIITQSWSDPVKDRLIQSLELAQSKRFDRAMRLLTASPLFHSDATSSGQNRRESNRLSERQLDIKFTLEDEALVAKDANKPYDPVDRVRALLIEVAQEEKGPDGAEKLGAATKALSDAGIYDRKSLNAWGKLNPQGSILMGRHFNRVFGK